MQTEKFNHGGTVMSEKVTIMNTQTLKITLNTQEIKKKKCIFLQN